MLKQQELTSENWTPGMQVFLRVALSRSERGPSVFCAVLEKKKPRGEEQLASVLGLGRHPGHGGNDTGVRR